MTTGQAAGGIAFVLAAAGCGGGPKYAAVEGVVTDRGQPLVGVKVEFLPDPGAGSNGPMSWGVTDAQGRYRVVSDRGPVGAVVGTHRVCVVDTGSGLAAAPPEGPEPSGGATESPPRAADVGSAEEQRGPTLSRIPEPYSAFLTTPLTGVEVGPAGARYDIDIGAGRPQ